MVKLNPLYEKSISLKRALICTLRLISVLTSYFTLPHLKCLAHWVAKEGNRRVLKWKLFKKCKNGTCFSQSIQPKVDRWCKKLNVCVSEFNVFSLSATKIMFSFNFSVICLHFRTRFSLNTAKLYD